MKLYTEEQVHSAMLLALGRHGIYIPNKHYQDLIDLLTPIELPSDEEIEKFAFEKYHEIEDSKWFEPLQVGAKWLKNKIQGGNK